MVIIKFVKEGQTKPTDFIASFNGGDDLTDVMFVSSSDWAYKHDGLAVSHPDGNEKAIEQIKNLEQEGKE